MKIVCQFAFLCTLKIIYDHYFCYLLFIQLRGGFDWMGIWSSSFSSWPEDSLFLCFLFLFWWKFFEDIDDSSKQHSFNSKKLRAQKKKIEPNIYSNSYLNYFKSSSFIECKSSCFRVFLLIAYIYILVSIPVNECMQVKQAKYMYYCCTKPVFFLMWLWWNSLYFFVQLHGNTAGKYSMSFFYGQITS